MTPLPRLRAWIVGALLRRPLEANLAVLELWWGLWALSPWWDVFAVLPSAYSVLGVLPEWAWGAVFTVHGLGHCYSVVVEHPAMCRRALIVSQHLWGIVWFNFLVTIPLTLATPTYGMPFLASVAAYQSIQWRLA